MRVQDDERSAARWRAILEARWRLRLQEVTELSVAYHAAASGGIEDRQARRLLRRAVAARQRLADTEDALDRVAAGAFGRCEQCGTAIPEVLLAAAPESRYCTRCAATAAGTAATGTLGKSTVGKSTFGKGTVGKGTGGKGTMGTAAGRR